MHTYAVAVPKQYTYIDPSVLPLGYAITPGFPPPRSLPSYHAAQRLSSTSRSSGRRTPCGGADPERIDGDLHTAAGEGLDRIDRFFVAGIDRVDRADFAGGGQRFFSTPQ